MLLGHDRCTEITVGIERIVRQHFQSRELAGHFADPDLGPGQLAPDRRYRHLIEHQRTVVAEDLQQMQRVTVLMHAAHRFAIRRHYRVGDVALLGQLPREGQQGSPQRLGLDPGQHPAHGRHRGHPAQAEQRQHLGMTAAKAVNRTQGAAAGHQAQHHQTEQIGQRIEPALGAAMIGHPSQTRPQQGELGGHHIRTNRGPACLRVRARIPRGSRCGKAARTGQCRIVSPRSASFRAVAPVTIVAFCSGPKAR